MLNQDFPFEFNQIRHTKSFEVSALITAYLFDNIQEEPYWERYAFSQIFLVLEGSGSYITGEGTYPLEPGMMFYRPAHQSSCYSWDNVPVKFALLSFVCDSAAMELFGPQPVRLFEEEIITLLDVIQTAVRICEPVRENEARLGMRVKDNVPEVVLSFIYASLERFLAMVYCRLENITLLRDESQKVSRYVDETRLVAQVRNYLSAHLSQRLTLRTICEDLGISQTALMKHFRNETNQSVMEFFNDLKIDEAKRQIQKSSESFSALAESLGFSSVNYFSKVFKSRTGMTPTQYSKFSSKRRIYTECKPAGDP